MAITIYADSFIEEVKALLRERQNTIADFNHGILVAGTSGTLKGKAVYDPKGEDIHAKRGMLTRFWNAAKAAGIGLRLMSDLTEDPGCFVIDAPTEEQVAALAALEV